MEAVTQFPEMPYKEVTKPRYVATLLIIRICNDLRCVAMLTVHGYSTQALSLTASIYETAFTVAYIGNEENLAEEWLEYSDPTKPFRDAYTLTEEALTKIGVPNVKQRADNWYKVYRQLC